MRKIIGILILIISGLLLLKIIGLILVGPTSKFFLPNIIFLPGFISVLICLLFFANEIYFNKIKLKWAILFSICLALNLLSIGCLFCFHNKIAIIDTKELIPEFLKYSLPFLLLIPISKIFKRA
jgi:hypothetical protein